MIPFQNFPRDYELLKEEFDEAFMRVMKSGNYILGPETEQFEREFAAFVGSSYSIGVANGLEAIQIVLMALGIGNGDEVITTPLSAIATTLAILAVGATPVFCDIDQNGLMDFELVESLITNKTKAVLPVHLYGNVLNIEKLASISKKYHLFLVEDAAQAHGAYYHSQHVGTFGVAGCFSFYPTKNLGAIGDAGAIVTSDRILAEKIMKIRNYGQAEKYNHVLYGLNSRLDELQAALLRVKLKCLSKDVEKRRSIAQVYESSIIHPQVNLLKLEVNTLSSRHLFVIKSKTRNQLQTYLLANGITALVHYPTLIPDQPCFGQQFQQSRLPKAKKFIKTILSLPIYPSLITTDAVKISKTINRFES